MRIDDFLGLLPLMIVASFSIIVMAAAAIRRTHLPAFLLTVTGLVLSIISLPFASLVQPRHVTRLIVLDGLSFFFMGLIFAGTLFAALLSYDYLRRHPQDAEEYYILLLLAATGAGVTVTSAHLASFFLGTELLSISLYALIAYRRTWEEMVEAGIKYLLLSAVSSAFLLFGTALLYAELGTMQFSMISAKLAGQDKDLLLLAGIGLMLMGFGFKLALVPFHMWAPDVYQGAPAPVAAFIATVSKGAILALLLRFFGTIPLNDLGRLSTVLSVLAIASMFVGNLLALFQRNLKRLLAYSSISHFGYLLVALLASGPLGVTTVSFYLTVYFVTILGIFGIVTLYSQKERDADLISDYQGLFFRDPLAAVVLTAMLFSLAGIPLTAGFVGRFLVIVSGVASSLWPLVIALAVSSAIGIVYYMRVIAVIYAPSVEGTKRARLALTNRVVVSFLLGLLIFWGVHPASLLKIVEGARVDRIMIESGAER